MKYQVLIRLEAEADLKLAFDWYEDQAKGLGAEFFRCVDAAVCQVERSPEIFAKIYQNVRRVLIHRFPYGMFYIIENDTIVVLAVLHVRRDPKQWQKRH